MTNSQQRHVPVLLHEAIDFLRVRPNGTYVDCTLGLGGHSEEIFRRLGPAGRLVGFDRDPEAFELAKARLERVAKEMGSEAPQLTLVPEAFSSIARHIEPASVDGLLADFGVSSLQFDQARRGFSFQADGPLDMRMDTRSGPTAEQVVNEIDERELANLVYEYGEERRSRTVARAIVRGRPVTSTGQLARLVASAIPGTRNAHLHPATRTFQALRIYVNRELDEIHALVEAAPSLLKPSARIALIAFHSLEDRIVKDSLRDGAHRGIWQLLTKKPVTATEEETDHNPRSRSAKLRAAERTAVTDLGAQIATPHFHR
jgi:16S rRNA (cytosine1402-N4)-methyltransferase